MLCGKSHMQLSVAVLPLMVLYGAAGVHMALLQTQASLLLIFTSWTQEVGRESVPNFRV